MEKLEPFLQFVVMFTLVISPLRLQTWTCPSFILTYCWQNIYIYTYSGCTNCPLRMIKIDREARDKFCNLFCISHSLVYHIEIIIIHTFFFSATFLYCINFCFSKKPSMVTKHHHRFSKILRLCLHLPNILLYKLPL